MDELKEAYLKNFSTTTIFSKKYLKIKKENVLLQNQLIIVSRKKKFYLLIFKRLKMILMHIRFLAKPNFHALMKMSFP